MFMVVDFGLVVIMFNVNFLIYLQCDLSSFSPQEMDDDLDTSLEEPQHDCQGNKDAARALLRVKQKLDGYEDGEMRSIHGQVFCWHISAKWLYKNCVFFFFFIFIQY